MTYSELSQETLLRDWINANPQAIRVFEELGIDYCCGGGRPLAQACKEKGLETENVIRQLVSTADSKDKVAEDWTAYPLDKLCDHIKAKHHDYLKSELPRLTGLMAKVVQAHGENHPELKQLQQVFSYLEAELSQHLMKEEEILFPMIISLVQSKVRQSFHCGSVANPIGVMEREHESAGDSLKEIRGLTRDFSAPADACASYRELLRSLQELEFDLHQHIHKENNVLFPKIMEYEASL